MMASGMRTRCKVMEFLFMLIKTYIKVNLIMIRLMGMGNTFKRKMAKYMKGTGVRTSLMEKVSKYFKMALFMKVILPMD